MSTARARCFLLFVLSAAGALSAQTIVHVPGDFATIQEAIVASADGDTVLVAPGTYVEELDYLGKAITVESEAGAASTILSHVNSAVSFVNGEGPGSVLRGFTVTGNYQSSAAIWGPGATPRIERCVIRGNRPSTATVYSDATIEDCVIEDNQSSSGTSAGVFGAPTLRRCILRGNSGYDAVALRLTGGRVEDCQIVDNGAGEGSEGGAIAIGSTSSVVLERCLIANNYKSTFSGQYCARGAALYVGSASAPAILVNCTVTDNHVVTPCFYGPDNGGLFGPVRLVNCIVRGNDGLQFEAGVTSAIYSDVGGGLGGAGNLDADPLFRDAASGDYRLLPGSPCIDAGSPGSPLDFDGSRADMGALPFTHAVTAPVNGRGLNLPLLTSSNAPVLGSTWTLVVHAALVSQPAVSGVAIKKNVLQPGLLTPWGELLITGARIDEDRHSSNGVADSFPYAVPPDLALLGFECFAQGFVIRQGAFDVELGNALRVVLGL